MKKIKLGLFNNETQQTGKIYFLCHAQILFKLQQLLQYDCLRLVQRLFHNANDLTLFFINKVSNLMCRLSDSLLAPCLYRF